MQQHSPQQLPHFHSQTNMSSPHIKSPSPAHGAWAPPPPAASSEFPGLPSTTSVFAGDKKGPDVLDQLYHLTSKVAANQKEVDDIRASQKVVQREQEELAKKFQQEQARLAKKHDDLVKKLEEVQLEFAPLRQEVIMVKENLAAKICNGN